MFDINNIQHNRTTRQYTCCCQCNSSQEAKFICAKYVMVPKTFDVVGELYSKGPVAIIGATSKQAAAAIGNYINANYFMPPLDVYVFYGSSQKGLESRWCVGFDYPQEQVSNIINILNNEQKPIIADNNPKNWQDKSGNSYSIVMLTEIMEYEPSEELQRKVSLCLNTIRDATARNLNPITI